MKNCKNVFVALLLGLSCSLASATTCPTPEEWHGIKTRAFFNKLAVGSLYCKSYKTDLSSKYEDIHNKLTLTTYKAYYISQIDLANKYYDRVDGIKSRPTDRMSQSEDYGQNRNWDKDETKNLNKMSLQAIKARETDPNLNSYCEENYKVINDLLAATSAEQIDALAVAHPYAREHGLTACDSTGEITIPSVEAPAAPTARTPVVSAPDISDGSSVPQSISEPSSSTAVLRSVRRLMYSPPVVNPPVNPASCDESQKTSYPASCDLSTANGDEN
jgi:hypothetical protein